MRQRRQPGVSGGGGGKVIAISSNKNVRGFVADSRELEAAAAAGASGGVGKAIVERLGHL